MLKDYPKFKRGEIERRFNKLPKKSQDEINEYVSYRESTGLNDSRDLKRYTTQLRVIIECDFKEFNELNDVVKLSLLVKNSHLSKDVKYNLNVLLSSLFKYFYPCWMSRFKGLKCFSNKKKKKNGKDENGDIEFNTYEPEDLPTQEDDKKIMQTETTTFWKTLFICHAQTGNRTKETRTIKNKNITFNDDGTCEIEIIMTKNGGKKYNFLNKQATDFIKKLQEEQKNTGTYGKYLFHSPGNPDEPISKNAVNCWFRMITKKATGREIIPYLWRHRKATELYTLATENKISMDAAAKLMGHSKDMAKTYVHRPDEKTIEILRQQLQNVNVEISPEKKHELEQRIEVLERALNEIMDMIPEYSFKQVFPPQTIQEQEQDIRQKIIKKLESERVL